VCVCVCVCEDDFVSFVNNLPFKSNAEHCKAKSPLLQSSKNEKLFYKRNLHQTVRQKNLSVNSILTPLPSISSTLNARIFRTKELLYFCQAKA